MEPADIEELLAPRLAAGASFFDAEADRIARLCQALAERFSRGGRLIAVGVSPAAMSDVRHVAVEFVHPVIVGKRALPALALKADAARLALTARPEDAVLAFEDAPAVRASVELARARGCLTAATAPCGAEWELVPDAEDAFVEQEIVETLYHVLWETVHTFLEHAASGGAGEEPAAESAVLYPFLGEGGREPEAVVADVRDSVLLKAQEVSALREQTLRENAGVLGAAAAALRASLDAGGSALALGNGGSATDAMDAVADLVDPPRGWRRRPALDLTEDSAIVTAIANDVGVANVFARQVIAYGQPRDVVLAFSTSGDSTNVIAALAEARRRGLASIAFVGYDGGRIARDALADFVVVSRSQHIPRIQEAQGTAWHVLRELVEQA